MKLTQWWPALAWAAVIFATSCTFIPSKLFVRKVGAGLRLAQAGNQQSFDSFWRDWWWLFVKGYHVLEFLLLCTLVIRALREKLSLNRALVIGGGIALVYAASDEYHQTFVKDRGGKWTDVAIDSIGVTLAMVATYMLSRRKQPSTRQDLESTR